ncbi:MAG TPA: hypothetical protein QGF35_08910 [Dehalococcoidia bacterium]|nr:hypothetical protein [Dehalococcoidia bacterium]
MAPSVPPIASLSLTGSLLARSLIAHIAGALSHDGAREFAEPKIDGGPIVVVAAKGRMHTQPGSLVF